MYFKRLIAGILIPTLLTDASLALSPQRARPVTRLDFTAQALVESPIFSGPDAFTLVAHARADVPVKREAAKEIRAGTAMSPRTWTRGMKLSIPMGLALTIGIFGLDLIMRLMFSISLPKSLFFTPLIGIVLTFLVWVMMVWLLKLGSDYSGKGILPRAPSRLFGFSHVHLGEVDFISEEGRSLFLNENLAASLDPRITPRWLRVLSRGMLGIMGASGHSALHSIGIKGEGRTWFLMQFFVPALGFAIGALATNLALGPSFKRELIGGIVSTGAFTAFVGFILAAAASTRGIRLLLSTFLLRLHSWKPPRHMPKMIVGSFQVSSRTIWELIQNDPSLLKYLDEIDPARLERTDAARLKQMQSDRRIFAELEGMPLIGSTDLESYKIFLRFDPDPEPLQKSWEAEFFLDPSGGVLRQKGKIGSVRLRYNPVLHMLVLSDLHFDAPYQDEGLYRAVLRKIVFNLSDDVRRIKAIVDPEDLRRVHDRLENTREWRAMTDVLGDRGLKITVNPKTGMKNSIDCELRADKIESDIVAHWPEELRNAPPGLWEWWNQNSGEAIPSVDPIDPGAASELDFRRIELRFWAGFVSTFDMDPPAALMLEVSVKLRNGTIDESTLGSFLRDLPTSKPLQGLDYTQNIAPFIRHAIKYLNEEGKNVTVHETISTFNVAHFFKDPVWGAVLEVEYVVPLRKEQAYWAAELIRTNVMSASDVVQLYQRLRAAVAEQRAPFAPPSPVFEKQAGVQPAKKKPFAQKKFESFDLWRFIRSEILADGRYDALFQRDPNALLRLIGFLSSEDLYVPQTQEVTPADKITNLSLKVGNFIESNALPAAAALTSEMEFIKALRHLYQSTLQYKYRVSENESTVLQGAFNYLKPLHWIGNEHLPDPATFRLPSRSS